MPSATDVGYDVIERVDHDACEAVRYCEATVESIRSKRASASSNAKKSDSDDGRFFKGVLNANRVDRQGERIDPMGVDASGFKRAGGPVLVQHFSEVTTTGRSTVVARVLNLAKTPQGLIIKKAEFDTDDISEHFMGKVFRGFIRGLSAGFLRRESELRRNKDGEQHVVVTKSELIHAILTTQPASRESLIAAKSLDRIAALESELQGISERFGSDHAAVLEELSAKMAELSDQVQALSESSEPEPDESHKSGLALSRLAESLSSMRAIAHDAAQTKVA